jgi:ribose/xylose/arabinose/galactoside ABC-type transport system permease subunit
MNTKTMIPSVPITARRAHRLSLGRFLRRPEAPSLLFLMILVGALSLASREFLTLDNVQGILTQIAVLGIVALGVNQIILCGEIDVSTGSLLAVCAFAYGVVATSLGGTLLPLLTSLIVGGGVGLVNGFLVTSGRLPSIIATLGTQFVLRGLILLVAGALVLDLPSPSRVLGIGTLFGIQMPVLVLLGVFVLFAFLSRHSTWGRDVLAIGGNRRAAHLAGVAVNSVRFRAFVLGGLSCGLAAAVFLSQIGELQATAATGFELQVIAAVVIGGTSIKGGWGGTAAPLVGATLIGVILDAMAILKVAGVYQDLVLGFIILLAIASDVLRRRMLGKQP